MWSFLLTYIYTQQSFANPPNSGCICATFVVFIQIYFFLFSTHKKKLFHSYLLLLIQRKIFYRKNETPTPDWSGIISLLPDPETSGLEGSRGIYSGKREMGAKKKYNTRDGYGIWKTNTLTFEATETAEFLVMEVPMVIG